MTTKTKLAIQVLKGKHGGMQLVLTEDVANLGKQGDVVEVRPGYGRNYLIPRGLGTVPTPHNLRLLERFKIRVRQALEARVADSCAPCPSRSPRCRSSPWKPTPTRKDTSTAPSPRLGDLLALRAARSMPIGSEMVRLERASRRSAFWAVEAQPGPRDRNRGSRSPSSGGPQEKK